MSAWDVYEDRINSIGSTRRGASLQREKRVLNNRLQHNLSYQTVTVFDKDHGYDITSPAMISGSFQQNVAIINSDNLNEKYIFSLPDEDIRHGDLIEWMDNHWLVTERDANTTVYTKAKLLQCNYLLKWVSEDHIVHEQWCVIEDGTKYLTGEYEDRYFVTARGDSRIAMTIARNAQTLLFNRKNRFIIDDPMSPTKLAYTLSKPLKLGWSFNNEGCYKFVLQEINTTNDDNLELSIPDYYLHVPKDAGINTGDHDNESTGSDDAAPTGEKVWL